MSAVKSDVFAAEQDLVLMRCHLRALMCVVEAHDFPDDVSEALHGPLTALFEAQARVNDQLYGPSRATARCASGAS